MYNVRAFVSTFTHAGLIMVIIPSSQSYFCCKNFILTGQQKNKIMKLNQCSAVGINLSTSFEYFHSCPMFLFSGLQFIFFHHGSSTDKPLYCTIFSAWPYSLFPLYYYFVIVQVYFSISWCSCASVQLCGHWQSVTSLFPCSAMVGLWESRSCVASPP